MKLRSASAILLTVSMAFTQFGCSSGNAPTAPEAAAPKAATTAAAKAPATTKAATTAAAVTKAAATTAAPAKSATTAATAKSATTAAAAPAGQVPGAPASLTTDGYTYPMNAPGVTISWASSESYKPNAAYASAADSPFHKDLQEMLGVKIDWQFPKQGDTDAAAFLNLLFASGDLPDVICGQVMKDAQRYMEEGTIYDLSPYIQKWSPSYYAWLQTNPAYDKSMKTDSGKYYGYGFFREDGGWNDTYLGPVVRKDWLDANNLPMPKTISDWDNTLQVFHDKYKAVLSFAKNRVQSTFISGAFGAYAMLDYVTYVDDNQKVHAANITPEYKDFLTKLNEWWSKGLIDQDWLTVDDTMARTNALNGKMGLTVTSMGQLSNWVTDAKTKNTGADWVGLDYPHSNDGKLSMVFGGQGIGTVAAVITTACPQDKLETVMRALDYAYTPKGFLFWSFGKEGESWEYGPDGKPAFLPLVTKDPDGLNNAIDKYAGAVWSGNCIQATLQLYLKNTATSIDANNLWYYNNKAVTSKWKMPSGVAYTADESQRAADIEQPLNTYCQEMAAKFITGEEPLANYDKYVDTVNSMGLSDLLKIKQDALDRYNAR